MFDVLADTHHPACLAEQLLDGFPRCNRRGGIALAEEVPAQEPSQVLEQTDGLVTADSSGRETNVVGQCGVVREPVCNHFCGAVLIGGAWRRGGGWEYTNGEQVAVKDGSEEVENGREEVEDGSGGWKGRSGGVSG